MGVERVDLAVRIDELVGRSEFSVMDGLASFFGAFGCEKSLQEINGWYKKAKVNECPSEEWKWRSLSSSESKKVKRMNRKERKREKEKERKAMVVVI